MSETAQAVERTLERVLPSGNGPEARVYEAMRYSCLGGGKRLRPFLAAIAPEHLLGPNSMLV